MKSSLSKEIIKSQLNTGLTKIQIAKNLNISIPTLNKLIKEYELTSKPKINRPDIDANWLITHWVNTSKSLEQLAEEENIPYPTLEHRTRKYNIKKPFKYNINESKLFNLLDPNIYYLMGLIATDGYVVHGKDAIELSLTGESEFKLLEDIKTYLELDSPIVKYNNYRLRITAKNLEKFVKDNFNISAIQKTFTLKIPSKFPNESCVKAYIRGCFDGDGCLNVKSCRLSMSTASEEFLKGLQELIYLYTQCKITYYIESRKDKQYPTLSVKGNSTRKILNWIYSEPGLRLERKYEKYLKVNDIV